MRAGLAALLLIGAAAGADKADFGRDQTAAAVPAAPAMNVGATSEYLASAKKNGRVTLGGNVIARYAYSRLQAGEGRFANESVPADGNGTFHASTWEPYSANLRIRVAASDENYLTMRLYLNDPWSARGDYNRDQLLKELYFTMENLCGSNFGVKFGKQRVPFGMVKDVLAIYPYLDSDTGGGSFLKTGRNGAEQFPARPLFMEPPHSAAYSRRYALIPYFKADKTRFEFSVFQDRRNSPYTRGDAPSSGRDHSGGRDTNDPGLSFSGKATVNLIENLEFSASVASRYNRGADLYSDAARNVRGDDRMWATSLAFDWNPRLRGRKFNFFGEWQHAWNPGEPRGGNGSWRQFIDKTSSDDIHAGLAVNVAKAVTLHAQYEWLRGRWNEHGRDSRTDLHRAIFAGKYAFASDIYAELGCQREWARTRPLGGSHSSARVDVVYMAMGRSF